MNTVEVKRLIKEIEKVEKKQINLLEKVELTQNELEGLQDNLRCAMDGDTSYLENEEIPVNVE